MSYPDFFCMGFQKCGTTTLYEILKQHPGVVLCRDVKEPMYYRVPGLHLIGGGRRYYRLRYFGHVKKADGRLKGEINAGLTFSGCAKRLRRNAAPGVKMIFMMRDPVERSYSAYKYFLARGFLSKKTVKDDARNGHAVSFDHYVHMVLDNPKKRAQIMKKRLHYLILSQSNYASCIREYLQYFNVQNMKFVFFEEFIRDQQEACRDIYDFLGIEDSPEINYAVRANEGKERPVSWGKAKKTMIVKGFNYGFYEFLAMTHWAPGLYARFRNYYKKVRRAGMENDPDRSRVMPQTRAYLEEYFRAEIRDLEKLTGKDLKKLWGL